MLLTSVCDVSCPTPPIQHYFILSLDISNSRGNRSEQLHNPIRSALAMSKRGVFVLLEGVDRCGKTTQTRLLREALAASSSPSSPSPPVAASTSDGERAQQLHFPDRSTAIGQSINAYLTSSAVAMDDRAIHLLFSANRWEAAARLEQLLASGVHVVVDRYSFSGVAFSAAKPGMTLDWCWQPEVGLPQPDAVIFLDTPVATAAAREGFGEERYETTPFQERVRANFHAIMDKEKQSASAAPWHVLDATESIEQVHARVLDIAERTIERCGDSPIAHFAPW
jgi:dTMP kinase